VEGEQESKVWRVQLRDRSREEWWEVQDLFVERERAETLFTKESYVQVWERRRGVGGNTNSKGRERLDKAGIKLECIDSSSVKNKDLSPYRDFLEWNRKEQHRYSCQSCEAFPPLCYY